MANGYPQRSHSSGLPLILAGAAFVMTAYLIWDRMTPAPVHREAQPRSVTPRGQLADYELSTIAVYDANRPSVVHITSPEQRVRGRWGRYDYLPEGTGSGIIWDAAGYVVTNYHVIQGRTEVIVRLADNSEHPASVVGARDDLDIAVVKITSQRLPPLRPIEVGESSNLRVGQTSLAIGNPFGLDHTLTTGVISALERTIESIAGTPIRGVIQVDNAINPGNSGGPLLDSAGRLIGMNTAIKSPSGASAGIGFAVPVDTINRIVPELIQGRPADDRLLLGFNADPVELGGIDRVMISQITPNSGAAAAGLRGREFSRQTGWTNGDVIVRVAGSEVQTTDDIANVLTRHEAGDRVPVTVMRQDPRGRWQELTVDVELQRAAALR